jgi:hypothetical protein
MCAKVSLVSISRVLTKRGLTGFMVEIREAGQLVGGGYTTGVSKSQIEVNKGKAFSISW